MTVEKLIKSLEKCDPALEVYFQETQTKQEDGVEIGKISIVDAVYEVALCDDKEVFNPVRVELSSKEVDE